MSTLDHTLLGPWAAPVLQRNTVLDTVFYDTGKLSPDEHAHLQTLSREAEGGILVVEPAGASAGSSLRPYADAPSYLASADRDTLSMVVAGVGSSVVGTAALARNVADATGRPAAGVISGYGWSDLMAEAMGGWFFYGAQDRLRDAIRRTLAQLEALTTPAAPKARSRAAVRTPFDDLLALRHVLAHAPTGLRMLVGHSKGCLLIDAVLEQLADAGAAPALWSQLTVVTLGAVVDLPPQVQHAHQFLGSLDWFGGMNSRVGVPYTAIPGAWHHLNTEAQLPCLPVDATRVIREHVPLSA